MGSRPRWRALRFRIFASLCAARSRLCRAALETRRVLQELDLKYGANEYRFSQSVGRKFDPCTAYQIRQGVSIIAGPLFFLNVTKTCQTNHVSVTAALDSRCCCCCQMLGCKLRVAVHHHPRFPGPNPAVAEANGCSYCLPAHAYLGKNLAKLDDAEMSANRHGASNDSGAGAAVRFAVALVRERGHVGEDDVSAVKAAGDVDGHGSFAR